MGLDNLDRVIDIIRKASSHASAAANLKGGNFFDLLNLLLYNAFVILQLCARAQSQYSPENE